ncbi:MAG: restriction endonuclease subunit S [Prevotellaceae bacterium]|nr:restriction endonuclease subunit S [Prevotellaceae bacterium]
MGEVCMKTENIKWKENYNTEFQYIDLSSVNRENSKITETQIINSENAPIRAQQIVKYEDVIFGTTRPTLKRFCFVAQEYDNQICSTGFCVLRANREFILPKYLYFILTTTDFYNYVENNQEGAGYPAISNGKVMKYKILIPTLEKQNRIVAILDKFEALVYGGIAGQACNDGLAYGLPAEIKMRRQQYEYYRNKLLTFKTLSETKFSEL